MGIKVITPRRLKKFRQHSDSRYVQEGEYSPETSVGTSDFAVNLTPFGANSGARDDTPFIFQTSGGQKDVGSIACLNELRGNTIKYNQFVSLFLTETAYGVTATASDGGKKLTFSGNSTTEHPSFYVKFNKDIRFNHKILFCVDKLNVNKTVRFHIGQQIDNQYSWNHNVTYEPNSIATLAETSVILIIRFDCEIGEAITGSIEGVHIHDLTEMFGAGKEPASYEEFVEKTGITGWDEPSLGELRSAKPSSYKIVGYNAFGGSLKKGWWIDGDTGEEENDGDIRSAITNFIKVVPGQTYTPEVEFDDDGNTINGAVITWHYDVEHNFIGYDEVESGNVTVPSNCHYVKIGFSCLDEIDVSKTHFCFHLTWDESKVGFEEYYHELYPLPNIELRKVGNVCDTLTHEGKLTRRVGVTNFRNLDWEPVDTDDGDYRFTASVANIKAVESNIDVGNILTELDFKTVSVDTIFDHAKLGDSQNLIGVDTDGYIHIYLGKEQIYTIAGLTEYIERVLSMLYVYYELDEPVETTNEEYKFTYRTIIDDFGTQEFIGSPVPVGNDFFYIADYKAFMDTLGSFLEYDIENLKKIGGKPKNLNDVNQNNKDKKFVMCNCAGVKFKGHIQVMLDNPKGAHFYSNYRVSHAQCWNKPYGNKITNIEYGQPNITSDYERCWEEYDYVSFEDLLSDLFGVTVTQVYNASVDRGWSNCPFDSVKNDRDKGRYFTAGFEAEIEWDEDGSWSLDDRPLADYLIDKRFGQTSFVTNLSVATKRAIKFRRGESTSGAIANAWLEMQIYIYNDPTHVDIPSGKAKMVVGLKKRTFK